MFTKLAALGVGLVTAAAAVPAAAHEGCPPGQHRSSHGVPPAPTYAPAPAYAPAPYAPVPGYAPAPYAPPRGNYSRNEARHAAVLSRADYNHDGGITLGEARAYGRSEFARADRDRNGVLVRGELRGPGDDFADGRRARDGVVTYAEYDANVIDRFQRLDDNRDGYLSRYELGQSAPAPAPRPGAWSVGWHWSL
jgi:hypothetical protein